MEMEMEKVWTAVRVRSRWLAGQVAGAVWATRSAQVARLAPDLGMDFGMDLGGVMASAKFRFSSVVVQQGLPAPGSGSG